MFILVTGASSGIGRDSALALAAAGHHVIAAARRLPALEQIRSTSITPLHLDLDDPASIAKAVAEIDRLTEGHGLDVLVNNAGYATAGALAELSDAALRAQFETNVFGLMALTRALLPPMIARGRGRVINVSSVSGRIPAPVLGAYHASKYALEALSDALRMELAAFGVQVVVVEPGTTKSEFASRALAEAAKARGPGSRYTAVYDRAAKMEAAFDRFSATTKPVVRAIVHAISVRRPRARYVAPKRFTLLIAFVRMLPTSWADAAMRRAFGLTRAVLAVTEPKQLDV
jgi:short-subunit dehydrogenase